MPTLHELGRRITDPFRSTASFGNLPSGAQAAILDGRMPGGSLEGWLSSLASPGAYLEPSERLHNLAIALELTRLIVSEVEKSENSALSGTMPFWLARFISLWDRVNATVVSFNYDTLLEKGTIAAKRPWIELVDDSDVVQAVAVSMLKMHGSTNWFWYPADRVGTTVRPEPLSGRWGDPHPVVPIPGMERFVVPPLATKSDYYDLAPTHDDWSSARAAIATAKQIVLLGYSVPETDLTVTSLLSSYADPNIDCVVVDRSPDSIVERLHRMGLHKAQARRGKEPIPEFAADYELSVSSMSADALALLLDGLIMNPDDPAVGRVAGSDYTPQLPITRIEVTDHATVFVTTQWKPGDVVADMAVKVRDVRQAIGEASLAHHKVLLRVGGDPDRAILHIDRRPMGRSWLSLEA